jgi:hypothetical protein
MGKKTPEICSGTYYPGRGKPKQGYYVVLDELVLSGPFLRRRDAKAHLEKLLQKSVDRVLTQSPTSKHLDPKYARTIQSVLRRQEKALTASMGGTH